MLATYSKTILIHLMTMGASRLKFRIQDLTCYHHLWLAYKAMLRVTELEFWMAHWLMRLSDRLMTVGHRQYPVSQALPGE